MMTHTADPASALGYWCRKVAAMKPGERLTVSRFALQDIQSREHNGATFGPADRIMGNIIGSAYTHSVTESPMDGSVTFARFDDNGQRRYTDPDRR
jgi:hypothetical protein